jgi:putative tricarboxylic transport membrane protein
MFGELGGFGLYTAGLARTLQPDVLFVLFLGTTIGLVFGVIPGLSATIGIAILTPFTFRMSTEASFALLLGVYCGSTFGGSISAILANIPGTIAAIMTVQDGYGMAQKGEAGRAIGLATISSFIGGILSVFALAFFAPIIATWALQFSAPEYFAVTLFGISVIAYVSTGSLVKGFISATLGIFLGAVGMDPTTAFPRFTFGMTELLGGLPLIPLIVGMFGFAEVLRMAEKAFYSQERIREIGKILPGWGEIKRLFGTFLRGSFIGVFIGAIPAAGGSIAAIISYGVEKRISRHPETFGQGEPRGIAAPESANNGTTGGAMIPMLTLGIPGDLVTALLIGALIIHGFFPGPLLFKNNPEVVSSIFISLFLSNCIFLVLGLLGARFFAKLITLPRDVLLTMILCVSVVGTYSIHNSVFDVWVYLFGGILGFVLTKLGIPIAPFVIGFILGDMLESFFRQALILSYGNPLNFFTRPIAATFLILTGLLAVSPSVIKKFIKPSSE